jgi:hypothetical protein
MTRNRPKLMMDRVLITPRERERLTRTQLKARRQDGDAELEESPCHHIGPGADGCHYDEMYHAAISH